MSYSTLYRVYRTRVRAITTYRNSYGSGRALWDTMARRYLRGADGLFALQDLRPVWDLSVNTNIPLPWRLALEFTFDFWVCPPALLTTLAQACDEVGEGVRHTAPTMVNHWPLFARTLAHEATRRDARLVGIGLGCSSICDPWEEWRPRKDPIYLLTQTGAPQVRETL